MALIGQSIAGPACEQFTGSIKHRNSPPADRTHEPRSSAAKVAVGPGDRDPLFNRLPFGRPRSARAIAQNDGV